MIRRLLPTEEWHRLAGTTIECLIPEVASSRVRVLVVEDDAGRIIGHLALMTMTHVHGLWVHPDHRKKPAVLRHLREGMGALTMRDPSVWMGAEKDDATMFRLLGTLGAQPASWDTYIWNRKGDS